NPALARLEVRKALSLAIDRDDLVKNVLGGDATPLYGPVPPGSGIEPLGGGASLDNAADPGPAHIQAAAQALRDAGWEYDDAERTWKNAKRGLSLSMTLKTSNVPELKAVASAVRDDWQKLGVPVAIELYEPGDLTQNVIRPREYDGLLFGMVV